MKKILSLILLALLPMVANAYDAKIDGIYYNLNAGAKTAEVTNSGMEGNYDPWNQSFYFHYGDYHGDIVIPETIIYKDIEYIVCSIGGGYGLTFENTVYPGVDFDSFELGGLSVYAVT